MGLVVRLKCNKVKLGIQLKVAIVIINSCSHFRIDAVGGEKGVAASGSTLETHVQLR